MTALDHRLRAELDALHAAGLARTSPRIDHREGVFYRIDGRPVVGFCSNDYLGLANHPSLANHHPESGATASRLICGDLPIHRHLESRLAELADTEDAILFPSGFQLNVGVLPAILRPEDAVFSDALNHASLIDGLRLSRVRPQILPHGRRPPTSSESWWISEALFSMDGDFADPTDLRDHLERGGHLYLDEAHSFGLFTTLAGAPTGFAGHHRLRPTLLIGTLGKSLGCAGAFVAASTTVCQWLRATARSFVYSTGTSPALAAQIHQSLDLLASDEGRRRRDRLWANIAHFAACMQFGLRSPIARIVVGANATALALSRALLERGWHVQAIRPPTVPTGTARLRITLSAAHSLEQISAFASDLRALLASFPDTKP